MDDSDDEIPDQISKLSRESSHGAFPLRDGFEDNPPTARRASTYSADLWSLPGQAAQVVNRRTQFCPSLSSRRGSATELIKLERSLSRTPQRNLTDPYLIPQDGDYMHGVTSTVPDSAAMSPSMSHSGVTPGSVQNYMIPATSAPLWTPRHSISDSPTNMASPASSVDLPRSTFAVQGYSSTAMDVSSHPMTPHYGAQSQMSGLHATHDIILDEPASAHHFEQITQAQGAPRSIYPGMEPQHDPPMVVQSPHQAYHESSTCGTHEGQPPSYANEISSTPTHHHHPHSYSTMGEVPYQEPQALPPVANAPYVVTFHQPPRNNALFYPSWDPSKEHKDDIYHMMPSQVHRSWTAIE